MNDFGGLLASDYGFKSQGKSAPMAASKGSANLTSRSSRNSNPLGASSVDDYDSIFGTLTNNRKSQDVGSLDGFADVFGGPPKFTGTSDSRGGDSGFNFDSMFGGSSSDLGAGKSSSLPKYDKPVYDDDIFEGVPGLKSSSTVKYDDLFSSVVSPPESTPFDDFLGSLSGTGSESKSSRVKGSERVEKGVDNFDDLLPGFGGSSPHVHRHTSEASRSSKSTIDATRTAPNMMEDPFVVIGSASPPEVSSPMPFTDPLEETDKFNMYGSTKFDVSSVKGSVDDMDPLGGLGKSVPAFSSEISDRGKDRSFLKKGQSTSGRQTLDSKESTDRSSVRSPDNQSEMKRPGSNYPESPQTLSDTPKVSNSFHDFVGQTGSPPSYVDPGPNMMNSQVNMSPTSEDNLESSDDVWLTVSEIALFTQPTSAPPPSRPPPPRPAKVSKVEMGSFASRSAKKTVNGFSSVPNSTHYFESSKSVPAVRGSVVSQIDQLEDFAMGRTRTNINEHVDVFSGNEVETNSDAAASAAAMKEAMDRAEAKFRHAKEVRERENAKAARSREAVQLEKDEKAAEDAQERAPREKQERAEHERQRREREEELREERRIEEEKERTREVEREQRKLEKERERAREIEREREKARQAVERATREARERAAAEARLKAEKAAVEKVNAEARQRAERAAVQRAQAEARERAAAEAKERAEKAAAEARERANAEVDARSRAERAAVERAAAEARQRVAADARERAAAAAAAKVNQQKNEDDLESFFGVGARPSSAPKTRANSSDPLFDTQFQTRTGPELARRTSVGTSSSIRKASSTTNIADDLSSIFGAVPSSGDFQEMEGESEERRRARLERHQRTQERAAKALAEKNQRDLQVQRDQAERHRIAETLDAEIKRWAAGKEGNLRALLSTMQYVLWPECGWQPVSLIDLINAASVKKVYRKATLCIHPDKVQQKGANLQQKYVAEKVFDLLKEAWNKFNSEELF